jgi:hypothetical protein
VLVRKIGIAVETPPLEVELRDVAQALEMRTPNSVKPATDKRLLGS